MSFKSHSQDKKIFAIPKTQTLRTAEWIQCIYLAHRYSKEKLL